MDGYLNISRVLAQVIEHKKRRKKKPEHIIGTIVTSKSNRADILLIRRKTLYNQSINQNIWNKMKRNFI